MFAMTLRPFNEIIASPASRVDAGGHALDFRAPVRKSTHVVVGATFKGVVITTILCSTKDYTQKFASSP